MDSRIVLSVVLLAFVAGPAVGASLDALAAGTPPKDTYTTKYDNIDVDQVLASKRLVTSYVQCLLDKKPCTPEGAELRKILPDALKTRCDKCSSTQKNAALKIIDRLQKDYDKEWKQLLDKWDPKRELYQKFDEYMKEEKKKGFVKF